MLKAPMKQIPSPSALPVQSRNLLCSLSLLPLAKTTSANMDIFQLFFNHLEERPYNNFYQNVKQDDDYLEATMQ